MGNSFTGRTSYRIASIINSPQVEEGANLCELVQLCGTQSRLGEMI